MATFIVWVSCTAGRSGWKIVQGETAEAVYRQQSEGATLADVFGMPEKRERPEIFSAGHELYWAKSLIGDHGRMIPGWVMDRFLVAKGVTQAKPFVESPMRTRDEWRKSTEGPSDAEVSDGDHCWITTIRLAQARVTGREARLLAGMLAVMAWAPDGCPLEPCPPF